MRFLAVAAFVAVQCVPVFAQIQTRIEYGKPKDLYNVKRVYVWTSGDAALEAEVRRQFSELLPMLEYAESEDESDVTLSVSRKEQPAGEAGDAPKFVTNSRLARGRGTTVYLFVDGSSDAENFAEAVAEVLTPVVTTFQRGNARRFGTPPRVNRVRGKPKEPTVLTTAGLHPGMSKKDVLASIGGPTRADTGHGFTSTWTYETTDGTMRLVFAGDRLRTVAFVPKK